MKKSVTIKTNFGCDFGANVPEWIKKIGFKGAIHGNLDGTCVIESSVELTTEEYQALYERKKDSLQVTSDYLQKNLTKDCTAVMQAIKESAVQFQSMEHELNLTIQRDNAEEEKLREAISKERKEREEKAAKEKKEKKDE